MLVRLDETPANDNAHAARPAEPPSSPEDPALRRRRIAADEAEREHIFSPGPWGWKTP